MKKAANNKNNRNRLFWQLWVWSWLSVLPLPVLAAANEGEAVASLPDVAKENPSACVVGHPSE